MTWSDCLFTEGFLRLFKSWCIMRVPELFSQPCTGALVSSLHSPLHFIFLNWTLTSFSLISNMILLFPENSLQPFFSCCRIICCSPCCISLKLLIALLSNRIHCWFYTRKDTQISTIPVYTYLIIEYFTICFNNLFTHDFLHLTELQKDRNYLSQIPTCGMHWTKSCVKIQQI